MNEDHNPPRDPPPCGGGAGRIRIGISGWTYAPWRGVFYPPRLAQKRELAHAAGIFGSIEINGTFYSLRRPENFAHWAAETPPSFVFAVKGPRFITHHLRLRNAEAPLANFFASGVLALGCKLGPVLWQLPPGLRFDAAQLAAFMRLLPHDTETAAVLARRHDERMQGRAFTEPDALRPVRHALEIRHVSFAVPEFVTLLRAHKVALVCADSVAWPRLMDLTADFVYCRLHGSKELYASGYDAPAIDAWAARVVAWARGSQPADAACVVEGDARSLAGRDVFVYFDNDAKVRAPFDAQALSARVAELLADG